MPNIHRHLLRRIRRLDLAALVLVTALASCTPDHKGSGAPAASSDEGLRLLHTVQDAMGGAPRIAAVADYEEGIRAEAWDERGTALGAVRKRTRWIRSPNVIRLDQVGPRGTYVLFFDGGTGAGWEILPDLTCRDPYKTTGKAVPLAGGELQFARGYLFGFELNQWLADRLPGYAVTSPRPGVLRIQHGDENPTDFTIDAASGLPAKSSGVSLADPDHPVPGEMRYDTWQEVSGVRFPTHRVNYLSNLKRGEVTTAGIRVNTGLRRETLAATPADFSPEVQASGGR